MSKLKRGTAYYGLFEKQELVRVIKSRDHDNLCMVQLYDGREIEFWIKKEKFALLGLCSISVGAVSNPTLPDMDIWICPLSDWDAMDQCFRSGRNGPANLPRIL